MEVLNSSAPTNLGIRLSTLPFTSEFPTKTSAKRNHIKCATPSSVFHKNSSFPIYFPISNTRRNFLVFSQFGRATNRRNSLRKKLIEDQQQVRRIPSPLNPGSDFQISNPNFGDTGRPEEKINHESVEKVIDSFDEVPKSKFFSESILFNKLENWVERYKKDTEYWGIGSGPIFTVFLDPDGNVQRVSVDENEVLRRSGVEREGSKDVNLKILHARSLAREMKRGKKDVIPRNSSVAKFVVDQGEESSFFKAIRSFALSPIMVKELPRVGMMLIYGFVAVWTVKKLFGFGDKEVNLTESEKEVMSRKIKSGKEKEMLEKGSIEVVQKPLELPMSGEKPRLDKEELMRNIAKAKSLDGSAALLGSSISPDAKPAEFDGKVQEIRKMAREARQVEGGKNDSVKMKGVENEVMSEESYRGMEDGKLYGEEGTEHLTQLVNGDTKQSSSDLNGFLLDKAFGGNENLTSRVESLDVWQSTRKDLKDNEGVEYLANDATSEEPSDSRGSSAQVKPRVIRSVKEARKYLSEKGCKEEREEEPWFKTVSESSNLLNPESDKQYDGNTRQELGTEEKGFTSAISDGKLDSLPLTNASKDSAVDDKELVGMMNRNNGVYKEGEDDIPKHQKSLDHEGNGESSEVGPSLEEKTWNEDNYNEHIVNKIGVGFRDNYMVAREKNQQSNTNSSMKQLESIGDVNELEWMEDDKLAEIVFQVRENELAGRDPFFMMDAEDKNAFFKGLEKKVERENEKLSTLHEWLHSNIENLDYGADGISLYDPPEKIIPRWKGPPLEKSPEFLNNLIEQREAIFAETAEVLNNVKKGEQDFLQKTTKSPSDKNSATSPAIYDSKKKLRRGQENSKTIIEGSDGSVKAGKKSGKEFWQHTKKWSRGFLESYNAETDPEVKSIMRDMGKDLDRWITEKEIQEAAELMDKLPERNKEFIEKKLNKLKREMELFGPQAVVSKYREYADEKEEDYLWWLDLPCILCIEMYTVEDGEQRIGFYSLEMATDLELEPKPQHVISFEDANDCKNFCYIIQAHLEMLGNGHAFVVARPPKDAFREAKENGFNVTVIRKGELQLNVDQTLEEVEEQITEIGSKMYHDMIMRERSVDMSSLMKGVFGFKGRPARTKRTKAKKMLKKRGKQ